MSVNDPTMNGSHGRHYIAQANSAHGTIVRLQEENAALKVRVADLEMQLTAQPTQEAT